MDELSLVLDPDEELEKQLASLNLASFDHLSNLGETRTLKQASPSDNDFEPRFSHARERESRGGHSQAPHSLRPLLAECGQTFVCDFEEFIRSFPSDPLVSFSIEGSRNVNQLPSLEKVGEASYSEVFGIGGVVLKIIPMHVEEKESDREPLAKDVPPMSEPRDVLKEIIITRTLGSGCRGYIKLLK